MVTPGAGLLGDPYRVIDGMSYPYPVNLRSDPYAASLCEKSKTIMNMTANSESRSHEDATGPRKRIAMACGRCRKRKIRCSGDNGDGLPCTNCTNSNHTPCQFLRVNSCETHYRDGFNYNLDLSRLQSRQPVVLTPSPSPIHEPPSHHHLYPHESSIPPYRSDPAAYSFASHNTSRLWNQEADHGNIEYTLSANTGFAPGEGYMIPYRPPPQSQTLRSQDTPYWTSTGEPSYGYAAGHSSTLVFRPANMVSNPRPNGPGAFPILNSVPGNAALSNEGATSGPSDGRRPLPNSAGVYRHNSVSPSQGRASESSPISQYAPISVSDQGHYPRFDSSPSSAGYNTSSSAPHVVEVKLEGNHSPEGSASGQMPLPTLRSQGQGEFGYRFSDTTGYRTAVPQNDDLSLPQGETGQQQQFHGQQSTGNARPLPGSHL